MAKGYNLTVQLNLQGPSNLNSVVNNINKQLGGINANVNVKLPTGAVRQIAQVKKQLQNVSKGANTATSAMESFGKAAGLAVKRFGAFTAATAGFYAITRATQQSLEKFLEFDKQITRIAQVTNSTRQSLGGLASEITKLSTSLGASSSQLAEVSVTLSQAGLNARETQKALKALALTTLAPTFNDLNQTVEGSIALMRQFSISTNQLEKALGSINAVAGSFAVEAGDLITAVQRAGGVFAAASQGVATGTEALNQFLAVFTSVRATTRESAETIATGLRTIFTRIQREDTIAALEAFGVTLTDLEGKFVGPFKAIEQLSQGLSKLDPRSLQFSGIVEELGGFRQVGKVIPLIQRFTTAQQALNVAQQGSGSLAKDAAIGQQSLSVQISKVREEFDALIRSIGQTTEFQQFIRISLDLASALIKVADAIKPVLPALAALGAAKLVGGAGQIAKGFRGGLGFNSGGLVPGSGNTDSVRANLTPGEYVIRKKAVQAIGVSNLERMNRYAKGGPVSPDSMGSKEIRSRIVRTGKAEQYSAGQRINAGDRINLDIRSISFDGGKVGNTQFEKSVASSLRGQWLGGNAPVDVVAPGYGPVEVRNRSKFTPAAELADKLARYKLSTMGEAALSNQMQNDNINLGRIYVAYNTGKLSKEELDKKKLDRKKTRSLDKIPKKRAALGGPISGKDTVPALLTPGEYVLSKDAASAIGNKTLNQLNRADKIYGYNDGGLVGFDGGGGVGTPGNSRRSGSNTTGILDGVTGKILVLQGAVSGLTAAVGEGSANAIAFGKGLQGLSTGVNAGLIAFQVLSKVGKVGTRASVALGGLIAVDGIIQGIANSANDFNKKIGQETFSKALDNASKNLQSFSQNLQNAQAAQQFTENIAQSIEAAKTVSSAESSGRTSLRSLFSSDFITNIVGTSLEAIGLAEGFSTSTPISQSFSEERINAANRVRSRQGIFTAAYEFFDPEQFNKEVDAEIVRTRSASSERFGAIRDQLMKRAEIQVGAGASFADVYGNITKDEREAIARSNVDVSQQIDKAGGADTVAGQEIINKEVAKQLKISLGPSFSQKTAQAAQRAAQQLQAQLSRVFSVMEQSFKAVAANTDANFARAADSLSASLGKTTIGYRNTATKTILENPKAFSDATVKRTISSITPLLGNKGQRIGSFALASTRIEDQVSNVIDRGIARGGEASAQFRFIGAELQNLVTDLNLGTDVEKVINNQLQSAFDLAKQQLGKDASPEELRQKVQEIVKNLPAFNGALKVVMGAFETFSNAQNKYSQAVQSITEAVLRQQEYFNRSATIRREGDLTLRRARGENISINDVIGNVEAAVRQQTGGTANVNELFQKQQRLLEQREKIVARRDAISGQAESNEEFKALTQQLANLDIQLSKNRSGLEMLANSTAIASAALDEYSRIQARGQEKAQFAERLVSASPEDRFGIQQDFAALENIIQGGQLTLQNSFPAQQAMMQTMMEGGTAGQVYTAGGQALAAQRGNVLNLLKELKPFFGDNNKKFNEAYEKVLRSFLNQIGAMNPMFEQMFKEMKGDSNPQKKAIEVYNRAINLQSQANEALGNLIDPTAALVKANVNLNSSINNLIAAMNNVQGLPAQPPAAPQGQAQNISSGGIVYASKGQLVEMKPKGTDTVPAMLTPGEFVVNAKATKKNRGLLESINGGGTPSMMNGVAYANDGGSIQAKILAHKNTPIVDRYKMRLMEYKQAYGMGVQRVIPIAARRQLKNAILYEDALLGRYVNDKEFREAFNQRFSGQEIAVDRTKYEKAGVLDPVTLKNKILETAGNKSEVSRLLERTNDPRNIYTIARKYGVDLSSGEITARQTEEERKKRIRENITRRREEARKRREAEEAKRSPGIVKKEEKPIIVPAGPAQQIQKPSTEATARDAEVKDPRLIGEPGGLRIYTGEEAWRMVPSDKTEKTKVEIPENKTFDREKLKTSKKDDEKISYLKTFWEKEEVKLSTRQAKSIAGIKSTDEIFMDFVKDRQAGKLTTFDSSEYPPQEIDSLRTKYPKLTEKYLPTTKSTKPTEPQVLSGSDQLKLIREKIAAEGGTGPGTRARRRSKPEVRSRQENIDALSAFGVGAAENTLPTLVGAGAIALAPFSGGTSLGALGLLGIGVGAGAATSYVQDAALQNVAPELYEQKEEIKERNPAAAFIGGLADPTLARGLFKPGKLARLFAEGAAQREAASAAKLAQRQALLQQMIESGVAPDVAKDAIKSFLMTGDTGFINDAVNTAREISTRTTLVPKKPTGLSKTVGQPYGPAMLPTPTKAPPKASTITSKPTKPKPKTSPIGPLRQSSTLLPPSPKPFDPIDYNTYKLQALESRQITLEFSRSLLDDKVSPASSRPDALASLKEFFEEYLQPRRKGGIVKPKYLSNGGFNGGFSNSGGYASPSEKLKDKYKMQKKQLQNAVETGQLDPYSAKYEIYRKAIDYGFGFDAAGRPVLNNPTGGYGDPRSNEKDYMTIFGDGNTPVTFVYRKNGGVISPKYLSSGGLAAGDFQALAEGTDRYPAMLSRGEMVMNPEATRKNKGLLKALNKSRGGMVKNGITYAANGTDGGLGVSAGNGELRITGDVSVTPNMSALPEPISNIGQQTISSPTIDTSMLEQTSFTLTDAFGVFSQSSSALVPAMTDFSTNTSALSTVLESFSSAASLLSGSNFGVIKEGATMLQTATSSFGVSTRNLNTPINNFGQSVQNFVSQTSNLIQAISTMGQVNGTINVVGQIEILPLQVNIVGLEILEPLIAGVEQRVLAVVGNSLSNDNPGINVNSLNVGSIV